jgi:hypothetical protein
MCGMASPRSCSNFLSLTDGGCASIAAQTTPSCPKDHHHLTSHKHSYGVGSHHDGYYHSTTMMTLSTTTPTPTKIDHDRHDDDDQELRSSSSFSSKYEDGDGPEWGKINRSCHGGRQEREGRGGGSGGYDERNNNDNDSNTNYIRVKPWNDPNRSLPARVQALVEASRIHPADISAQARKMTRGEKGSSMERLMEECLSSNIRN